jgi:hypothetical protein
MKIKHLIAAFVLFVSINKASAQAQGEEDYVVQTPNGDLYGTIMLPEKMNGTVPVVLLVSGSGPTDMNGNQDGEGSNNMKMIAESLRKSGIASCRFDKRGVGKSAEALKSELDIRFDNYVEDLGQWINLLSLDPRFSKVIIAGHSEGSLVGMIAANYNSTIIKGFISLDGAGRPADEILKEQFASTPKEAKDYIYKIIDTLKKGDTIGNVPPIYAAIFRQSVQPYMISWFKKNPQAEIGKLKMPVLIVQGSMDIQVSIKDATNLQMALPKSEILIVPNMNHVLKDCDTMDKEKQKPIYSDPNLPLNKDFITGMITFIKKIP